MGVNKGTVSNNTEHNDEESLRGTLFSSFVFVGGGIILCIVWILSIYMDRI